MIVQSIEFLLHPKVYSLIEPSIKPGFEHIGHFDTHNLKFFTKMKVGFHLHPPSSHVVVSFYDPLFFLFFLKECLSLMKPSVIPSFISFPSPPSSPPLFHRWIEDFRDFCCCSCCRFPSFLARSLSSQSHFHKFSPAISFIFFKILEAAKKGVNFVSEPAATCSLHPPPSHLIELEMPETRKHSKMGVFAGSLRPARLFQAINFRAFSKFGFYYLFLLLRV